MIERGVLMIEQTRVYSTLYTCQLLHTPYTRMATTAYTLPSPGYEETDSTGHLSGNTPHAHDK